MILVVGGRSAGKREYVKEALNVCDADIAVATFDEKPLICDVQELVRENDPADLLPQLLEKQVVICNEVGSGVIPTTPDERIWRENVGRLCCILAKKATAVVRVCCGIPTVLKGNVPERCR